MAHIRFTDGSTVTLDIDTALMVVGKDADGNLVCLASWGGHYALTPCCNATGKGSVAGGYPATVCRNCYKDVGFYFGGDAVVAVHTAAKTIVKG